MVTGSLAVDCVDGCVHSLPILDRVDFFRYAVHGFLLLCIERAKLHGLELGRLHQGGVRPWLYVESAILHGLELGRLRQGGVRPWLYFHRLSGVHHLLLHLDHLRRNPLNRSPDVFL